MNIIIDYNQICLSPLTDSIVNILITLLFCYITKYFSSFALQDDVAQGGNRPRPEHSRPGVVLVGDLDLKKKVTDCHKPVWKRKDGLEEDVKTLKNQVDIEKGKLKVCKSQLGLKEEELNESKVAVENLN
jgi:hypothetical protein